VADPTGATADDRSVPIDPSRSIADLDGLVVERGAYESGRTAWLARALVSPLGQLGPAEWALLLRHDRGVAHVLPLAVVRLEREPLTPIDGQPGALLAAVLTVPAATWHAHPVLTARVRALLPTAVTMAGSLDPALAERVAEDAAAFAALLDDPS
jgi:hypothetical protein